MAAAPFGGPMTIRATATALNVLLNQPENTFGTGIIRALPNNAGRIWVGGSNVTGVTNAWAFMDAGEWFSLDLIGNIHTSSIYLVGTPGDVATLLGVTY